MDESDRPLLVVIIDGDGNGDDESPKSGGKEVFVVGGNRHNKILFS